jgi:hypothetical protein
VVARKSAAVGSRQEARICGAYSTEDAVEWRNKELPLTNGDVVQEIGRRLREERERLNLTLGEAAKRADLSPDHLREMEEGYVKDYSSEVRGPTLAKLERVANVYGLRVDLVRD